MNKKEKEQAAGIYMGPSFYGIIQKGTVLSGGYSPKMEQLISNHPFLKGLIVPTSQLAKKRKELQEKGSEIAMLYQRAAQIKEERHV